ncbi:Asp-tRNA(Asn)/Glu-tRNA(Gln) amidotransferase subunit GatA [Candidatus Microgenomates bacterium]|nr:Asp-tRNA(Asn)/Glu-tRNA(Gln) amidotransferase subunit GatA [Candidatus Microgenomates bacterium]
MESLVELTLTETIKGIKAKNFTLKELNHAYLERIKRLNDKLNAYLWVNENSCGISAAIKDLISTKGITTTAGSMILENYIPPYNATVIDKFLKNGVSILGKTNCDEFALGSSGENSAYGATLNPWNLAKVPGGTSSGSAAAVAADLCTFALGSDTGGSIRQPAALCGVVGLKPSYGRVSRYGLIAAVSSFDTIGPITKCVADARQVLSWISGPDGYDATCVDGKFMRTPERWQAKDLSHLSGVKIGIPKEYFEEGLDRQVESVIRTAIKKLEELGAEIIEVSLQHTKYAISTYYIINSSEVSSNLARFDGVRFGKDRDKFGEEVKRRIMLGTFSLSSGYYDEYFTKAAQVRTLIKQDFEKAYEKCDVIIGPVSPTVAWNMGEKMSDPLTMYLSDVYTIPASLAGIPGLSVPCGFVDGLPVGLQILGKYMDEETILNVGEVYENATEWHKRKPELA